MRRKELSRGFTLLEVLFAVAFLILVGVAMTVLNGAGLRLISNSELSTVATNLSEESVAYLTIIRHYNPSAFDTTMSAYGCSTGAGCYVNCPTTMTSRCSLQSTPVYTTIGNYRVKFLRKILVTKAASGTHYILQSTISWGSSATTQEVIRQYLD